eukprot:CAMPEP_0197625280 /NCGR_PEP_ID=MMETSP1338-20131121/4681_1 /TAXON_ID=43686 ORGANISM="Pelagodinium beii, Strain RCC1491" /NCGR_SAMPLE_ID=MMETSP1338 /ASSEMBLY_ACC=CAM_ASM_000754 /LENGTH=1140 /DNA_ID=CAMNT_0043195639 /DNA_START=54 /DNA_END=3476 /DNA_ORIENTATION=+
MHANNVAEQCSRCRFANVRGVALSRSAQQVAAFDASGGLHLCDEEGGQHFRALQEAPAGGALCFAQHIKAEVLYAVGHKVRVVDATSGRLIITLLGHRKAVTFASAAGDFAVTLSSDVIILWMASTWSCVRKLHANRSGEQIAAVQLGSCGAQVAILYTSDAGTAARVAVWSTSSGDLIADLAAPSDTVDDRRLLCPPELAFGDGFVAARCSTGGSRSESKRGFLLVWHLLQNGPCKGALVSRCFGEVALLEMPRTLVQVLARQVYVYAVDDIDVMVISPSTEQIVHKIRISGIVQMDLDACGLHAAILRHAPSKDDSKSHDGCVQTKRLFRSISHRFKASCLERLPRALPERQAQSHGTVEKRCLLRQGRLARRSSPRSDSSWSSGSVGSTEASGDELTPLAESSGSSSPSNLRSSRRRPDDPPVGKQSAWQTFTTDEERLSDSCRRLKEYLHRHGSFPSRARAPAWRLLLRLPRNEPACKQLDKAFQQQLGLDGTCADGRQTEDSSEHTGAEGLPPLRRLEAWFPGLAGVSWITTAVEPFARIFCDDDVLAFEACACLLLNWAGPWLECFPDPPLQVFSHAEELLHARDPLLGSNLQRLVNALNDTAKQRLEEDLTGERRALDAQDADRKIADIRLEVLWPMARSLLADCLPQDAWLTLWDHLLVHWREPWLLGVAAIAVLRCVREKVVCVPAEISSADAAAKLQELTTSPQAVDAKQLLAELHEIRDKLQPPKSWTSCPSQTRKPSPLPLPPSQGGHGKYPELLRGSHTVLDYLTEERALSRAEASAVRTLEREAQRSCQQLEKVKAEEAALHTNLAALVRAEKARAGLMKEVTSQQVRKRQEEVNSSMRTRLHALSAAGDMASSALLQQRLLKECEATSFAEEERRRRMNAKIEEEAWRQNIELSDLESWAARQLVGMTRETRDELRRRNMRRHFRKAVEADERKQTAESQQRSFFAQHERAEISASLERDLQEESREATGSLRCDAKAELTLEALRQRARSLKAAQAGAGRKELIRRREQSRESHHAHSQRLVSDARGCDASAERTLYSLRVAQEQRLQTQFRALEEAKETARRSLEEDEDRRYQALLASEREKFQVDLQGARIQDEFAAREAEERLGAALDVIQEAVVGSGVQR